MNNIDLGDGHTLHFVSYEGDERAGANVYHKKPDGSECGGFIAFSGGKWASEFKENPIATWDVQSFDPLTCSPSLLCRACGDHGFIRGGRWVKA
jgi:hypothetical protein